MLKCLGAVQKRFEKSAVIYHAGDIAHAFGLVLSGRVQVENDDFGAIKVCWPVLKQGIPLRKPMPFCPGADDG